MNFIFCATKLSIKAIARAVYARQKLAVFDDVFSGLDTITEELVFSRVFGQQGLLRQTGTTVILATHGGDIFLTLLEAFS
jgi:ABC-type nitrate/sulfonate/bicarbonate transport system ATPase subunit